MKKQTLLFAAWSLAVVGAGCASSQPALGTPQPGQTAAPPAAPTQAPVIPPEAKNVPVPSSEY
ncbi:MAG: hypothetical protein WA001_02880 [Patescibacteria group bacterium]